MRIRVVLAGVVLGLAVVTLTLAQQQTSDAPRQDKRKPNGTAQPGVGAVAALRTQVAQLRAEVELLELEHEADKALLFDLLKELGRVDSPAQARDELNKVTIALANTGYLDEITKKSGDEKAMRSRLEKDLKDLVETHRADSNRMKKAFVLQATELNEKKFALAELEKQLANVK
jgi:hypothetical protein